MIAFFTVVTVILPAFVLAGIVAFAVRDTRERDSKFTVIDSQFTVGQTGPKAQSLELRAQSLPTSKFSVRLTPRARRRFFNFLCAKLGKCS
jgi:hypothetical protein